MDSPVSIKERYLSIINNEWKGLFPDTLKVFLFLLSCIYRCVLGLRWLSYNAGILKRATLPVPVISVGNITLGGVGKTPLVEYIAHYLKSNGKRVAILSRGYGSKKRVISGNDNRKVEEYNDEHLMLRENLPDVPNIIDHDRVSGGKRAIAGHNVDCLILDDGFQHLRLNRALDIVAINALNPFGYERVIPCGFLREPLKNLQRAGLFIITHTNLCEKYEVDAIRNRLNLIKPSVPVIESIHEPSQLENISNKTVSAIKWLEGKKVYAFCAIGCPESFLKSLENSGAELVNSRQFLDHHFYSREELGNVVNEAIQLGADAVVTTQKDKVKIIETLTDEELETFGIPFHVLKISIKITAGNEIPGKMIDALFSGNNEN